MEEKKEQDLQQEQEQFSLSNKYLPGYFQLKTDENMSALNALGRDSIAFGILHRALLKKTIYGPGRDKNGAFNPGEFWDSEMRKYNRDYDPEGDFRKEAFLDFDEMYNGKVQVSRDQMVKAREANSRGGKATQQKKNESTPDPDNKEQKNDSGIPDPFKRHEIPKDVQDSPEFIQSMYNSYKPLNLSPILNMFNGIKTQGTNHPFLKEYLYEDGIEALLRHFRIPNESTLNNYYKKTKTAVTASYEGKTYTTTIISRDEQKMLLFMMCCGEYGPAFELLFALNHGFRGYAVGQNKVYLMTLLQFLPTDNKLSPEKQLFAAAEKLKQFRYSDGVFYTDG